MASAETVYLPASSRAALAGAGISSRRAGPLFSARRTPFQGAPLQHSENEFGQVRIAGQAAHAFGHITRINGEAVA